MFYDTHAHLDFPDFAGSQREVIARAEAAGITRIITIGTTEESSRRAIEIAGEFPGVFAAVGWHPGHVTEAPASVREELAKLAAHPKAVAIGEIGLDYYRLPSSKGGSPEEDEIYIARQKQLFREQLEVAESLQMPVVIHQRESFDDTIEILSSFAGRVRSVFHCFPGTIEQARTVQDLGGLVSFTGIVTFKNAEAIRNTVKALAPGDFMLETDSPFLAPVPHRGKTCEPAFVAETARFIAGLKGCSLQELSERTCEAAHKFFGKKFQNS